MRFQSTVVSDGRILRGITHFPDKGTPKAVVCMFAGFDGTKVGPHRLLVQLSEALEAEGVASVRYDLTGVGDSDGRPLDISREVFLRDAATVLQSVRADELTRGLEIMTAGYSFGALIAAEVAQLSPDQITGVIMISPMLNFPEIRERVLAQLGSFVNVDGNLMYRQPRGDTWKAGYIEESLRGVQAPMLMVTGSNDRRVPRDVYLTYLGGVLKGRCVHLDIEGAGHSFALGAWTDLLIQSACNFVMHRPVRPHDLTTAPNPIGALFTG